MLNGHNGPVFDSHSTRRAASWPVPAATAPSSCGTSPRGERLDTFSQPTKEQYAVAFSPDGQHVIAGGVDSRIRVWQIEPLGQGRDQRNRSSRSSPTTARSCGWPSRTTAAGSPPRRKTAPSRFGTRPASRRSSNWRISRTGRRPWPSRRTIGRLPRAAWTAACRSARSADWTAATTDRRHPSITQITAPAGSPALRQDCTRAEVEPNDSPAHPMDLHAAGPRERCRLSLGKDGPVDADFFRFHAQKPARLDPRDGGGPQELAGRHADRRAARRRFARRALPAAGRPRFVHYVPADRFTARGRASGKLAGDGSRPVPVYVGRSLPAFPAPRGPDSEYDLYTQNGSRRCYFDTSAVSHTLNEHDLHCGTIRAGHAAGRQRPAHFSRAITPMMTTVAEAGPRFAADLHGAGGRRLSGSRHRRPRLRRAQFQILIDDPRTET